jgi:hypothetical protein
MLPRRGRPRPTAPRRARSSPSRPSLPDRAGCADRPRALPPAPVVREPVKKQRVTCQRSPARWPTSSRPPSRTECTQSRSTRAQFYRETASPSCRGDAEPQHAHDAIASLVARNYWMRFESARPSGHVCRDAAGGARLVKCAPAIAPRNNHTECGPLEFQFGKRARPIRVISPMRSAEDRP